MTTRRQEGSLPESSSKTRADTSGSPGNGGPQAILGEAAGDAPRGASGQPPAAANAHSIRGAWLYLIPGLLLSWSLSSWYAERSARLDAEAAYRSSRQEASSETGRDSALASDEATELLAKSRKLEEEKDQLLTRVQNLEQQLFSLREQQLRSAAFLDSLEKLRQEKSKKPARENLAKIQERSTTLRKLNRLFRNAGLSAYRFLDLDLDDEGKLIDCDLLVLSPEGVVDGDYHASGLRMTLLRHRSVLKLDFEKGWLVQDGKRSDFARGFFLELDASRPRELDGAGLAFLTAVGAWPEPKKEAQPDRSLEVILAWRDRLDAFLGAAGTPLRYEVHELRGVGAKEFRGVTLLGRSPKGRLERRIQADRMRICVDRAAGRVELRLSGGFVEGAEGRVRIQDAAYRLPLPRVTPAQAERKLTGFVQSFDSLPKKRR